MVLREVVLRLAAWKVVKHRYIFVVAKLQRMKD